MVAADVLVELGAIASVSAKPLANAVVFFAGTPIAIYVFFRLRPLRNPKPGICANCGYDLTGNASGRCPECGARTPSTGEKAREAR
jgi:tRNA(Ile2) C34 agmatinyltransferase TiaS